MGSTAPLGHAFHVQDFYVHDLALPFDRDKIVLAGMVIEDATWNE